MFPYKGKGYSGSLEIFFIFLDLCLDRGLSSYLFDPLRIFSTCSGLIGNNIVFIHSTHVQDCSEFLLCISDIVRVISEKISLMERSVRYIMASPKKPIIDHLYQYDVPFLGIEILKLIPFIDSFVPRSTDEFFKRHHTAQLFPSIF